MLPLNAKSGTLVEQGRLEFRHSLWKHLKQIVRKRDVADAKVFSAQTETNENVLFHRLIISQLLAIVLLPCTKDKVSFQQVWACSYGLAH